MQINYWAVLLCAILSMGLGFAWYGPLFGKKWMEITGANTLDEEKKKEMMKNAWKLYLVQFFITLFQAFVLAYYLIVLQYAGGAQNAFWIWMAFVVPTLAGVSMWNNDSGKVSWTKFLIQAGYQLAIFIMFCLVLEIWR